MNHGVVRVDRALWVHQAQPSSSRHTQSRVPSTTSGGFQRVPRRRPYSIGLLYPCTAQKCSWCSWDPPLLQVVSSASCPGTGHHWNSGSLEQQQEGVQ